MTKSYAGVLAILLLATAASVSAGQAGRGVSIALRTDVQVSRGEVLLGDLATIKSPDLASLERLMNFPVGRSSAEEIGIERRLLAQWVARHGPDVGPLDWSGAERVRVRFVNASVGSDCVGEAKSAIERWLGTRYATYETAAVIESIPLGDGQSCQVRALSRDATVAPRVTMWGDVFERGRFVRTVAIPFKVSAFEDTWVARHAIDAGTRFSLDLFERRAVDVARHGVSDVVDMKAQAASRVSRSLPEGAVLKAAYLESQPEVSRGGSAVMTSRVGSVRLETMVDVLQDGSTGKLVPVRIKQGGKSLMARVVSAGRVEAMGGR